MKKRLTILSLLVAALTSALSFSACHDIESWDNDYYGNFDALWTIMDEHYCFFDQKGIDWQQTGSSYREKIKANMGYREFFDLCSDMLCELHDGHTNLISWFAVSYYRNWWSDYPQNFDWRLIQQYYLDFDYTTGNAMSYRTLADGKVAYVNYSSFSANISDSFVDEMMLSMKDCIGMVLDIRDNGGGDVTNVERLVAHFIRERILAGYIQHKTGPAHTDFSEPYAFYYDPAAGVKWLKPVIILTNRSTFSAANNFVAVMKGLSHVAVVGDTTGGGCGMPFSSELPCGWGIRFSASPVYDADMQLTEGGIEPTEGGKKNMDPQAALLGHDTILDFAIDVILSLEKAPEAADTKAALAAATL